MRLYCFDVNDDEYDDSDVNDDEYGDVNDNRTGIEQVLKCYCWRLLLLHDGVSDDLGNDFTDVFDYYYRIDDDYSNDHHRKEDDVLHLHNKENSNNDFDDSDDNDSDRS